ncbi:MAG: hypothetical protein HYV07_16525 [Deltaproteobacteria bacterium]|nr:hypothetical protein [Deltaproteobacteria bacterium]
MNFICSKSEPEHLGFVLGVASAVLGAWGVPPALGDLDGANFAASLTSFDPLHQSPHFPGYPVFVGLARLAALGTKSEVWSLVLPALVLWPFALALLAGALGRATGAATGLCATAVLAFSPGVIQLLGWPGSDGLGVVILVAGAALTLRAGSSPTLVPWVGVAFALLLGVRLSWWPLLVLPAAFLGRAGMRAVPAFLVVTMSWVIAVVVAAGPAAVTGLAASFVAGHFTTFGGTALSDPRSFSDRVATLSLSVLESGLGLTLIPALVILPLLLLGIRVDRGARPSKLTLSTLLAGGVYSGWVLFAQNVDRPRHAIPIVLMLALGLASLANLRTAFTVRLALFGLALVGVVASGPRLDRQGARPAPLARLAERLTHLGAPDKVMLFAGDEARLVERLAPGYRVLRPRDRAVLDAEAQRLSGMGIVVYVSSRAIADSAADPALSKVEEFRELAVLRGPDANVALFRFEPPRFAEVTP